MANTTPTEISSAEKRILNNLPPRVRPFVDREEEIARVTKLLLDPDVPIVNIVGLAGVGKTALALEVAHLLLEQGWFSDGVCWVYCRDQDQALAEILETVQRTFDLRPRVTSRDLVRQYLASHKALLVLNEYDAITDDLEVLGFLGSLTGPSKALLTSRARKVRLSGIAELRLNDLTLEDGIRLFLQAAESQAITIPSEVEESVAEVVQLLSGHPLAIRLAVAQLRFLPLEMLKHRLRQGRLAPELKTVLDASIDLLSEQARTLFRRLAVFTSDFDAQAIDGVCQVDSWQTAVAELEQAGLLQRQGERYQLHPLTRSAALAELEKHDERETYEEHAAAYYLQLAQAAESTIDYSAALNVVRVEVPNVLAGQEWYRSHEYWQEVIEYARALNNLMTLGDFQDAYLTLVERALQASKQSGDTLSEANFLYALASVYQMRGRLSEATELYEQSLLLFRKSGARLGEANTLSRLADLHFRMDDFERATALYEAGLVLFREVGDRLGEANALSALADICVRRGDYDRATELYQISLALFRQVGARLGEANALSSLANVYQQRGDYQRATELYEVSLAVFRQLADRLGEANTLNNLANIYQNLADFQRARELYEVSLTRFRQLGDRLGEANTLNSLANIYQAQGRHSEAVELYETTLPILRQTGDRYGEAVALHSLGVAYQSLRRFEQARDCYEASLALKEQVSDRRGIAVTLHQLGTLAQEKGANGEAHQYYAQAITILESLGDARSLALTTANLGIILEQQAQYQEAFAYLDRSAGLFEQIGDAASLAAVQRYRARVLEELEHGEFDETVAAITKALASSLASVSQHAALEMAGSIIEYGKRLVAQERYRDMLHLVGRLSNELERVERDANRVYERPLSPEEIEIHRMLKEPSPAYQTLIRYDQQVLETAGLIKSILSVIARVATARMDGAPTQDYDAALQALELGCQVDKTTGQAFQLAQWVREVSGFEFVELEDADDWPPRVAYLVHLAARHERDENWQAAIDIYRQACELLSPAKSEKELVRSAEVGFRLALCLKQTGRWSEALKQQEANIAAYRKLRDLAGKANAYMEMGHIYQMMNLYDPALLYYGEAYYLYRQVAEATTDEAARRSARHGMANAKESLGNLEFQLKVLPRGVTDLEEAKTLYQDLGMPGKAAIIGQTLETALTTPGGKHG